MSKSIRPSKSNAKGKSKTVFVCQECGAQRPRWEGKCMDCGAWNSMVEEKIEPAYSSSSLNSRRHQSWVSDEVQLIRLDQSVEEQSLTRISTGMEELDRVLGGGLVPGSFLLVGGDPGVGKSTLLLQMAGRVSQTQVKRKDNSTNKVIFDNINVLYVSGEESVTQSALRAQRLGVHSASVHMAAESNLDNIRSLVAQLKPQVLVIDSIQTIYMPNIDSAPGSVSQVRECAAQLMALAKGQGVTTFLIGHVTKEGQIAGPKVLEHMVDTVLSFEGDLSHQFRLLRALKNRFGATNELGVFQMDSGGLTEVHNPSEMFLAERGKHLVGSAIFATIEGSRPLLCEVQALTMSTPLPQPRRTAVGLDVHRVQLLAAVLNKHAQFNLLQSDIFINVVGGLKLIEPAADLAVVAALISTQTGHPLEAKMVFFGEIGLTGEVRAVPFSDMRIREAQKLGFTRFVLPESNKKNLSEWSEKLPPEMSVHWIKDVRQLKSIL